MLTKIHCTHSATHNEPKRQSCAKNLKTHRWVSRIISKKKKSWCEFTVSHFCSTKCSSIGLWLHESYECLSHETVMNHIQISLNLVKSCDDNSGIWCVIKRCKSESIWPRNIVIFPFGNCNQQVIGLLKRVFDSLTSWQHQWRFSDSCGLGDSYGPIAYESQLGFILCHWGLPNGLHDLGETLPEMSRGVGGDSTKFHWCTMWWNTLFDVVGLCNYSPFVARLVCRNQNGVSHDTRKQWKQHGPVQGQMWKSSAAQDSLYIYI